MKNKHFYALITPSATARGHTTLPVRGTHAGRRNAGKKTKKYFPKPRFNC